jgi:hypothetical protein
MMRGELASELASECTAVFGGATMRGVAARSAGSRSAEPPAPVLCRQTSQQDQAAEMILGRSGRLVMPLQR